MAHTGGGKAAKYAQFAERAYELLLSGEGQGRCAEPGNTLLWLYYKQELQEAQDRADEGASSHQKGWMFTMRNCVKSLADHPMRITSMQELVALKGFGPSTSKIAKVLWDLYPPEGLSTQELNRRLTMPAGSPKQGKKKRGGAGGRKGRGGDDDDWDGVIGNEYDAQAQQLGQDPEFAGAFTMEEMQQMMARDLGLEHEVMAYRDTQPKRKKAPAERKPREPKEYVPKVGTANYAFLITLYISQKEGIDYETKSSLMQKAEASGLSDKSLFGAGNPGRGMRPGEQYYDGWSSFNKSLVNRTPPLATAWSNPKKVRLTPEGVVLAARMYKDALDKGKVAPLPGVDPEEDMVLPSQAGAGGGGEEDAAEGGPSQVRGAARGAGAVLGSQGVQGVGGSQGARQQAGRQRQGLLSGTERQFGADSSDDEELHAAIAASQAEAARAGWQWGAALAPEEHGYLYSSDEENDPYGYGLGVRDGLAGAKRQRVEGGGSGGSQGRRLGGSDGSGSQGAVGGGSQVALVGAVTPGQAAARAALARFDKQQAGGGGSAGGVGVKQERVSPPPVPPVPARHAGVAGALVHDVIVLDDSDDDNHPAPRTTTQAARNTTTTATAAGALGAASSGLQLPGATGAGAVAGTGVAAPLGLPPRGSGAGSSALQQRLSGGLQGAGAQPPLSRAGSGVSAGGSHGGTAGPSGAGAAGLYRAPSGQLGGSQQGAGSGIAGSLDRQDSGAGPTATSAQPYRWMLPTLSDMDSTGGPGRQLKAPPAVPGKTFSQAYEVVLVVDQREQFQRTNHQGHQLGRLDAVRMHTDQIRRQGLTVDERTLAIGDAIWVARQRQAPHAEYVLSWVLERKSCSDLIHSIQSKQRFHKQKHWLQQCGLEVLYLIEGNPDKLNMPPNEVKTIKTVTQNNEVDGIRVLRTGNAQETVVLLARLTHAITRVYDALSTARPAHGGPSAGMPDEDRDDSQEAEEYSVWSKNVNRRKADGVRSVRDVWGLMLAAVPGMGPNTVEAILHHYPTPQQLGAAYQQVTRQARQAGRDPLPGCRDLLSALPLPAGAGRVGPKRSRDVFELLFYENTDLSGTRI